jgi:hypothetical protein
VRVRRYRLECIEITVGQHTVHEANAALPRVGAAGQEMGDLFNLDLGI